MSLRGDDSGSRRSTPATGSRIGEAVSFAVSHETCADIFGLLRIKRILHDINFARQRQSPESRLIHHRSIHEREDCNHAQPIFLNGHNRNRDCCCSVNCVVACRYATESDHCVIVDQPHRPDGDFGLRSQLNSGMPSESSSSSSCLLPITRPRHAGTFLRGKVGQDGRALPPARSESNTI